MATTNIDWTRPITVSIRARDIAHGDKVHLPCGVVVVRDLHRVTRDAVVVTIDGHTVEVCPAVDVILVAYESHRRNGVEQVQPWREVSKYVQ